MICPVCAQLHPLNVQERTWLKTELAAGLDESSLKQGKGCGHCHHTGYQGRQGIYELLEIDGELSAHLNRGDTTAFRAAAQARLKGQTLRDEALRMVRAGLTSVAEAMRVTHETDHV
jgi:MSHA biogenesis protein MshE